MEQLEISVAGGGIGGLTFALAMSGSNARVKVFEQAEAIRPVGAGIVCAVNAMRVFRQLGVAEKIYAQGVPLEAAVIGDSKGKELSSIPLLELSKRFGETSVAIKRSALHEILVNALPRGTINLGASVKSVENGSMPTLTLADGTQHSSHLLVGADGLTSVVRPVVTKEGPLRYSGQTCWRGLATVSEGEMAHFAPRTAYEYWGPGKRFGFVMVDERIVYWYAPLTCKEGEQDEAGTVKARLLEEFRDWHPAVQAVLQATEESRIIRHDLRDRPPVRKWSEGRIVLLGDAIHPTTPNMGQGACMAIESAAVLAHALKSSESVETALSEYEEKRAQRTAHITNTSWRIGAFSHWKNPIATTLRNALLGALPASLATKQVESVFSFEVPGFGNRPKSES